MLEKAPPRWDLSTIYPALDSSELSAAIETIKGWRASTFCWGKVCTAEVDFSVVIPFNLQ
jgi:hypothetical protein